MNKQITIIIEWIKIIIEKGEEIKTIPINQHPIQYNNFDIKRKYYKKTDPEYHRKPLKWSIKPSLKFSKFDNFVQQEPLLHSDY